MGQESGSTGARVFKAWEDGARPHARNLRRCRARKERGRIKLYVLKVVAGALGPLTLDQIIMILLSRGCDDDTALYRAPQVLEVLCDPSFRPDLAAYAGQTRHPLTRLDKHLNTFETLNGCLIMHVLQAFNDILSSEMQNMELLSEDASDDDHFLNETEFCSATCKRRVRGRHGVRRQCTHGGGGEQRGICVGPRAGRRSRLRHVVPHPHEPRRRRLREVLHAPLREASFARGRSEP
ncbi:hypothetical protein RI054_10g52720 [Pseudoscourfieldia marina]